MSAPTVVRIRPFAADLWDGFLAQPRRVALAFVALAAGVAALTVLLAILGGLRERSRRITEEMGAGVVVILPAPEAELDAAKALAPRHLAILEELDGALVARVRRYQVRTLGSSELLSVVATDSRLARVREWRLLRGRFLDPRDLEARERHAVVSRRLGEEWSWDVGHLIMVGPVPFKVVGVLDSGGGALSGEAAAPRLAMTERAVFVPASVAPLWVEQPMSPDERFDALYLKASSASGLASTVRSARRQLAAPELGAEGFLWITAESLLSGVRRLQTLIRVTAGSVAALCLFLGATTLVSLMFANVEDRITEIGLRRALGARRWEIAALFVGEATVVTAAAAIVSTTLTAGVLALAAPALPLPVRLGWPVFALPLAVAVVVAACASYWPASRAARIEPAQALRNE